MLADPDLEESRGGGPRLPSLARDGAEPWQAGDIGRGPGIRWHNDLLGSRNEHALRPNGKFGRDIRPAFDHGERDRSELEVTR